MKITVENIKGLNKDIKVFVDKATINSYMDEKYEEIKGTVNLKGFRPGKVPREILKRQFGQAIFGRSPCVARFLQCDQSCAASRTGISPRRRAISPTVTA